MGTALSALYPPHVHLYLQQYLSKGIKVNWFWCDVDSTKATPVSWLQHPDYERRILSNNKFKATLIDNFSQYKRDLDK